MKTNRYLVFTTSKEKNGTAAFRDSLAELKPEKFIPVKTHHDFLIKILREKNKIQCIYALSDIHYIVAVAILKLFLIKIPVVLAYYHPDQWSVSLNKMYSKTQYRVMNSIIKKLPLSNLIFSSNAGFTACNQFLKSLDVPNIIAGPTKAESTDKVYPERKNVLSIVTIGRLVEFKVVTILAMVEVIEKLMDKGINVNYTIYGEGPSEGVIKERISNSRYKNIFAYKGSCKTEDFPEIVLDHHIFYGMGGAVVRAAMLGVPSVIAIQREPKPVCYGLFSDHDQRKLPVFGDYEQQVQAIDLYDLILKLSQLSYTELVDIGNKCKVSGDVFGEKETMSALVDVLDCAPYIKHDFSPIDILLIRLEKWISRIKGVQQLDT